MKPAVESTRWVIGFLAVLAAWMVYMLYVELHLPGGGKFLGGSLLAVGALNALFYKKTGRKFFAKTQSSRPFVAGFWARIGEQGCQLLYLGIGIILAAGGCVLLIMGAT